MKFSFWPCFVGHAVGRAWWAAWYLQPSDEDKTGETQELLVYG